MKLFICRCKPFDYFETYTDIEEARKWWQRNVDSAGTRECRMILWANTKAYNINGEAQ